MGRRKVKSYMELGGPFPPLSSLPPYKLRVKANLFLLEDEWMWFLSEAVSASPITALWRCCWVTWNTFSPHRISEPSLHTAQLPPLPPLALCMWPKRHTWVSDSKIALGRFSHVCCWQRNCFIRGSFHSSRSKLTHFWSSNRIVHLWPFLLCLSIYILWSVGIIWCYSHLAVFPLEFLLWPQAHQVFCRKEMTVVVSLSQQKCRHLW